MHSHLATRKITVEESLTLGVADFRDRLESNGVGETFWKHGFGGEAAIGYIVHRSDENRVVTLNYRLGDGEDLWVPIPMQATVTLGGRRWWFTCPLIVNGIACERRVAKLHLPRGATYFGCRICHRLSYRSSQTAHRAEREQRNQAWSKRWGIENVPARGK